MSDEMRNEQAEEVVKDLDSVEVEELDDKGLEDASGGLAELDDDNGNCNCAC
jgi:hypothetical protein